ncbi:hypothetical protein J2Z31_005955 [Sinorhizobium kostiense]|uniref:Uncharacterized protein n=1 Tax=Sinorhizobium kostiense TaxID=76747 RepID=A0ABS4R944_9HYPH|nr:hypothetical protein [Sinorhizobium kostiense]
MLRGIFVGVALTSDAVDLANPGLWRARLHSVAQAPKLNGKVYPISQYRTVGGVS